MRAIGICLRLFLATWSFAIAINLWTLDQPMHPAICAVLATWNAWLALVMLAAAEDYGA